MEEILSFNWKPTSRNEKSIWIAQRRTPRSNAYNINFLLRTSVSLQTPDLEQAFNTLCELYPILRSRYVLVDGELLKRYSEGAKLSFFKSLSFNPENEADAANDWYGELAKRSYDLENEPPIRLAVCNSHNNGSEVLLGLHHIIADGVSVNTLATQLGQLYRGEEVEREDADYSNFISSQSEYLNSTTAKIDQRFWKRNVAEFSKNKNIETGLSELTSHELGKAKHLTFDLGQDNVYDLREIAAKFGTTLFTVLASCVHASIGRVGGRNWAMLGVPVSQRNLGNFARTPGYFVNLLPVCLPINWDANVAMHLSSIRDYLARAIPHKHLPLDEIGKSLPHSNTLQTVLNYRTVLLDPSTWDMEIEMEQIWPEEAKYPLAYYISKSKSGLLVRLEYAPSRIPDYLAGQIIRITSGMILTLASSLEMPAWQWADVTEASISIEPTG